MIAGNLVGDQLISGVGDVDHFEAVRSVPAFGCLRFILEEDMFVI